MQLKIKTVITFIFILCFINCSEKPTKKTTLPDTFLNTWLANWHLALDQCIINDFFNPPVASRIYAYSNIALYQSNFGDRSILNPIISKIPISKNTKHIELTSLLVFYYTAKKLVFNPVFLDSTFNTYKNTLLNEIQLSQKQFIEIDKQAKEFSKEILAWARQDKYLEMRSFKKYEIIPKDYAWQTTPPDYSDALEPHWGKLRTLILTNGAQFRAKPPIEFSSLKTSSFFKELNMVYDQNKLDTLNNSIATYWDCNPLVLKHEGHLTYADKKLTPGGHWLNITQQICRNENLNFNKSVTLNTILSISIFDGFISCWDTKYFYNTKRPITAIHDLINKNWQAFLQTPNFPEYTSGHSVISTIAADILSTSFGENYTFIDSSEIKFGNKIRKFNSFYEARDEASISRFYGGIHFKNTLTKSIEQGEKISKYIINKINLKSIISKK